MTLDHCGRTLGHDAIKGQVILPSGYAFMLKGLQKASCDTSMLVVSHLLQEICKRHPHDTDLCN